MVDDQLMIGYWDWLGVWVGWEFGLGGWELGWLGWLGVWVVVLAVVDGCYTVVHTVDGYS